MLSEFLKSKSTLFPMPNTGSVLDISAGHWVPGHKGQMILNGGIPLWSCLAALPNMFKTTILTHQVAMILLAWKGTIVHVHDSETTMVESRIERLILDAMDVGCPGVDVPDNLSSSGRLFFTSAVDYDATQLFNLLKAIAKKRHETLALTKCEILDTKTNKPYEWLPPLVEFWDSFSGMNAESANDMLEKADVGTSGLNMLAMRVNQGKSQIVEQLPSFTARNAIYVLATAHVGQSYQLDPYKPNVRTLRFMKDNVKLKRVPENLSFSTGNCYVITSMVPMVKDGSPEFPYTPGDENSGSDLLNLKLTNMRGKFGPSDIPHTVIVSQRDGWLPYMSNFIYLKDNGKYGFEGNNVNFTLAFCPEIKLGRTTLRLKFRENYVLHTAALHLVNLHWMHTRWEEDLLPDKYRCEPKELYESIKAMGYDWDLLLKCRYWHGEIVEGEKHIPYLSTFDLLRIRLGEYHPYWYPVKKEDLKATSPVVNATESKEKKK